MPVSFSFSSHCPPGILYQIKRVDLSDGSFIYCLWISRDPQEPGEGTRPCHFGSSLTIASSANLTADLSLGKVSHEMVNDTKIDFTNFFQTLFETNFRPSVPLLKNGPMSRTASSRMLTRNPSWTANTQKITPLSISSEKAPLATSRRVIGNQTKEWWVLSNK